jgi:copper(I)-binding protein
MQNLTCVSLPKPDKIKPSVSLSMAQQLLVGLLNVKASQSKTHVVDSSDAETSTLTQQCQETDTHILSGTQSQQASGCRLHTIGHASEVYTHTKLSEVEIFL